MSAVVYTSEARIERQRGPLRLAYLPAEKQPVTFGVHGMRARFCPVYRSLAAAIDITTELELETE